MMNIISKKNVSNKKQTTRSRLLAQGRAKAQAIRQIN